MEGKKIIAIIPARGGSKGIPGKNIVDLGGFPLLAYSIAAAKLSKRIERVIVSTDSQEIADLAKQYGAEVPFLRPADISGDKATDIEFVQHALDWFSKNEGYEPDYMVHLRPTTPLRDPVIIDKAIDEFLAHSEATSLRSAHELAESPHKFFIIKDGLFAGLFDERLGADSQNLPRQSFLTAHQPNGYVDVIKTETVKKLNLLHGPKILPFITEPVTELDRPSDLDYLRFDAEKKLLAIIEYLKKHHG